MSFIRGFGMIKRVDCHVIGRKSSRGDRRRLRELGVASESPQEVELKLRHSFPVSSERKLLDVRIVSIEVFLAASNS